MYLADGVVFQHQPAAMGSSSRIEAPAYSAGLRERCKDDKTDPGIRLGQGLGVAVGAFVYFPSQQAGTARQHQQWGTTDPTAKLIHPQPRLAGWLPLRRLHVFVS